jgi:YD repeat-containing protein
MKMYTILLKALMSIRRENKMPSKMRHTLLISMTMIALLFATDIPSYAETINYIYDELNRLKRVEYGDGTVIEYIYDRAGNRLEERLQIADTTPPTTTASPAGGIYNIAQIVTLTCNDGGGSGCDKIYYTTDGSTPTTSSPVYSAPVNISVTTTLQFFAKDLAGNSEALKTAAYTIDTTPPTGTITINSGAASTNSTNVTLTLSCSDTQGCSQMQFSNNDVTYSTPEAYAATKAWTLTSGDGTRTVYVKFKDTAGNWSAAFSDTILLDTSAPTTTASPVGGPYNTAQTITLTCSDGTGSGCDKIYYTTDGTTPTTSSPVYASPINISVTTTLKFFARDVAGNSEAVKTETYTISTGTTTVTVQLKDSTGNPLSGGVVQYYSGGWKAFGTTDASGQVSKGLLPGTYTFSMNYAFARQEKSQNIASNPTVVFQTISAIVQLKDRTGALIDTGTVQYYSGGWRDIGSTSGGQVTKELLPGTYTFSMNYAFARQEKAQNIATNPTVVFQTTNVTIQLKDSTGALMDTGTVQYYSGGWRDIGSTSGGQVTKELLPGTYTFRMNYAYARQEKSQNIASNPTVVFQTISAIVQLKDSTGALIDTGTVQYYSGGWRDIWSTSGGQVTKELLPGTYTFSMNYAFARQEKTQNIASNPAVVFQTTSATVQLKDSTGILMDTGTVQYYSGGWRDIGSTSGGQVNKELLPGSYAFSMNYAFARQEKSQNIGADPTVVFNTGRVHSDSGSCTQYYAGGWRTFTQDIELLPLAYTFRFNDTTPDTPYTIISSTVNHIH